MTPGSKPLKNHKHEMFSIKYVETQNGTTSYRYAYPETKETSANTGGARLLCDAKVKERISYLIGERNRKTGLSAEWIIKRYMAIADADIREVVDWDEEKVSLKPSNMISDQAAYNISEVSSRYRIDDDGGAMVDLKAKTTTPADKIKALEMLGKHLGIFNDKLRVEHSSIEEIIKNAKKENENE